MLAWDSQILRIASKKLVTQIFIKRQREEQKQKGQNSKLYNPGIHSKINKQYKDKIPGLQNKITSQWTQAAFPIAMIFIAILSEGDLLKKLAFP